MGRNTEAAGWVRPVQEIEDALRAQIGFLRASCERYDKGHHDEALRLASTVFIIVHDGGKQRSLLTQLSRRAALRFFSYAYEPNPRNLLRQEPLTMMRIGASSAWLPVLDQGPSAPKRVQFHHWWEKEYVFLAPDGRHMNRRSLVFAMRNQDGGGHVDAKLSDEAYVQFSRERSWMTIDGDGVESPLLPFPHLPTMRHIAFELEQTLLAHGVISAAEAASEL